MKIKMLVQKYTGVGNVRAIYFGPETDSIKYLNIRYSEFADGECEFVEHLREEYTTLCRRLKLKELEE